MRATRRSRRRAPRSSNGSRASARGPTSARGSGRWRCSGILGFAASVAAAYADARRPVEETVDRMLEDGVDFAEEPVYAGRERSSVAKRIASVGSRVLGAVRHTLSSPSSPAPVVAVPVDEAGDSPEDRVPVVDGARTLPDACGS